MTDSQEEKTEILRAFAWRLGNAADAAGLSQIQIAEKLGVARSRVGNWFQGNNFPRKPERVALAKLLDVTLEWLVHGKTENDRFRPKEVAESRAEFGDEPQRQIPVISWAHAGEAVAYEEMPRHFSGKMSTTSRDPKSFGVTIEGDSMEPKAFPGDRVVCEPSRAPINGKPVIAKLKTEEVVLRVYHKLPNGKIRLSSMKPEIYPTLDYKPDDFFWIYPCKELIRPF